MVLTDKLTAIANAIRAKINTTQLYTLDEMPTVIGNIPSGGGFNVSATLFVHDVEQQSFIISTNIEQNTAVTMEVTTV